VVVVVALDAVVASDAVAGAAVLVVVGAPVVAGVVGDVVSGVSAGSDSSASSPPQLAATRPRASNKIPTLNFSARARFAMKHLTPRLRWIHDR